VTASHLGAGPSSDMRDDIAEVLFSEAKLQARVAALGAEIAHDYAGQDVLLIGALRGALIFLADLARQIPLPLEIDTITASSYGSATTSSGVVTLSGGGQAPIAGRHVLIVEDIVDTGLTLRHLLDHLASQSPASLRVCALLVKDRANADVAAADGASASVPYTPDYVGFHVPDHFVVGYGLDYDQRYRNLPYIGILKPEVYGG